tara:strand:- start:8070 stop:8540 length:471 start_codon:yes stop_codon:yes gene_type:complete
MIVEIPYDLEGEFKRYCETNGVENLDDVALRCFISGFNIEKYGPTPMGHKEVVEKVVEVEKIIEKIVSVEVPVTDDREVNKFIEQITNLREKYQSLEDTMTEKDKRMQTLSAQTEFYKTQVNGLQQEMKKKSGPLQKLMRGDFLRGSNLGKNLYDE